MFKVENTAGVVFSAPTVTLRRGEAMENERVAIFWVLGSVEFEAKACLPPPPESSLVDEHGIISFEDGGSVHSMQTIHYSSDSIIVTDSAASDEVNEADLAESTFPQDPDLREDLSAAASTSSDAETGNTNTAIPAGTDPGEITSATSCDMPSNDAPSAPPAAEDGGDENTPAVADAASDVSTPENFSPDTPSNDAPSAPPAVEDGDKEITPAVADAASHVDTRKFSSDVPSNGALSAPPAAEDGGKEITSAVAGAASDAHTPENYSSDGVRTAQDSSYNEVRAGSSGRLSPGSPKSSADNGPDQPASGHNRPSSVPDQNFWTSKEPRRSPNRSSSRFSNSNNSNNNNSSKQRFDGSINGGVDVNNILGVSDKSSFPAETKVHPGLSLKAYESLSINSFSKQRFDGSINGGIGGNGADGGRGLYSGSGSSSSGNGSGNGSGSGVGDMPSFPSEKEAHAGLSLKVSETLDGKLFSPDRRSTLFASPVDGSVIFGKVNEGAPRDSDGQTTGTPPDTFATLIAAELSKVARVHQIRADIDAEDEAGVGAGKNGTFAPILSWLPFGKAGWRQARARKYAKAHRGESQISITDRGIVEASLDGSVVARRAGPSWFGFRKKDPSYELWATETGLEVTRRGRPQWQIGAEEDDMDS
ncbi:unnamed protein product [Pylaiella littoralis]